MNSVPSTKKPRRASPVQTADLGASKSSGFLGNLPLSQKLLLLLLPLLIFSLITLGILYQQLQNRVSVAKKELQGTEYLVSVNQVFNTLSEHAGLAALERSGVTEARQSRSSRANGVSTQVNDLLDLEKQYGFGLGKSKDGTTSPNAVDVQKIADKWRELNQAIFTMTPKQSFAAHDELISEFVKLFRQAANQSGLSLDPTANTYWLQKLASEDLPKTYYDLGELRALSVPILARKKITATEREDLKTTLNNLVKAKEGLDESFRFALEADPTIKTSLEKSEYLDVDQEVAVRDVFNQINVTMPSLLKLTETRVISNPVINFPPKLFYDQSLQSGYDVANLLTETTDLLNATLSKRVKALTQEQLLTIGGILASLGLLTWLALNIINSITRPLRQLNSVAEKVGMGDLSQLAAVSSRDELGSFAKTLNQSIVQLRQRADADRDEMARAAKLQGNIGEFLSVAMDVAGGDFTKRGNVTEDVLGNVVDAINLMVDETGTLLRDVSSVATNVNNGAIQLTQISGNVLEGAETQAQDVSEAQSETRTMITAIGQMADGAVRSNDAAKKTLEAAQLGQKAVGQTLEGMTELRSEIEEIAGEINTLAERSKEIETVSRALEEFASQTNLLALNASFEAAGAGESGKRFAIIADEVRRLAEESARETQRVSSLVRQVQGSINSVVTKTKTGLSQANQSLEIATNAGSRLLEISEFAAQSSSLSDEIAALAKSQVSSADRVSAAIRKIASTAMETQVASSKGREAAESLRNLAGQLSSNIGRFRLPN